MKKEILFFLLLVFATFLYASGTIGVLSSSGSLLTGGSLLNEREGILVNNNLLSESTGLISSENNLLSSDDSLLSDNNTLVSKADGFTSYGSYISNFENINAKTSTDTIQSVYLNTEQEISISTYLGDYDKFIAIRLDNNSDAFVRYFSDWQRKDSDIDFFDYAEYEAEYESTLRKLYEQATKKFAIGTTVIVFDVVLYFIPSGKIYKAIIISTIDTAINYAFHGTMYGAIGGAISGIISGDGEEMIFAKSFSGAANGYLTGAITGTASGLLKSLEKYNGAKAVSKDKIVLKDGTVVNTHGKKLGKTICDDYYTTNGKDFLSFDGRESGQLIQLATGDQLAINNSNSLIGIISQEGQFTPFDINGFKTYTSGTWYVGGDEQKYIDIANQVFKNHPEWKQALKDYTWDSNEINRILQGYLDSNYSEFVGKNVVMYYADAAVRQTAESVYEATISCIIPEDIIVNRGMSIGELCNWLGTTVDNLENVVSQFPIISTSKVLSTSITGIPTAWSTSDVLLKLAVPKGTNGIYLGGISAFAGTDENELLLAPINNMLITEIKKSGSQFLVSATIL